ncbi:sensor histidine kinase [Zobellia galactanivorans]|uniref:Two-component system-Sensor histidine kinase n=1 Tax=Zobellia galactanivorans (strain DSM 12802 / CCUG 47099 / CIP 106680 / NCIMB 13871 / Dsij) TaxID=63186 RepID=G0LC70_ZOBGA|nr:MULTISPECIES: sensor histidine kinase [Zobellia]MBU3027679.1 sensor histidine kinase [Zobellia galactanivorans]MDO6807060.1 sensor histidine kinase [Zobellia galactanivorans]OWW23962.1 sensor histidine kinase [Zobellia sp. OII3]CAZ96697.1 Two-component system-Sensor histidine kinase [Zobellia galactanivorans]
MKGAKRKYLPQWLVHAFLWCALYGLIIYPFLFEPRSVPPHIIVKLVMATALFYFNYFYLVPRLLLKGKKKVYIVLSIVLLLVIGYLSHNIFSPQPPRDFGPVADHIKEHRGGQVPFFRFLLMPFVVLGIPYIFAIMLRVFNELQRNENLRKTVEKEKVQSELQFLKTQLNPHFLFNSLNTIYSLSVKKSPDTSEAIINLSELMRYMIYEADKDLVPLNKEIEYIKNYVALQRLRLADSENVFLKISGDDTGKIIPSLLFISFIENAFKYGTDYDGKTNVKINLLIKEKSIHLYVVNKIGKHRAKSESSGVGLQNVKNRLNFLYPNSHELDIKDDGATYEVNLILNL